MGLAVATALFLLALAVVVIVAASTARLVAHFAYAAFIAARGVAHRGQS